MIYYVLGRKNNYCFKYKVRAPENFEENFNEDA